MSSTLDDRGWFLKVITGKEDGLSPYTGEVYPGERKLILENVETIECVELLSCFDDAKTIMISHGIAHAFMNTGNQELVVIAYTDLLYVPQDTIAYKLV